MKTRIRRFWISVSLAAGSLAFPLSGALRAHDLPTRWTSGANSTGAWNYLLDDCFDMPMMPGMQSMTDVESSARRGTEDWASSCPAELAADIGRSQRSTDIDYEVLLRNPLSRFSKEMTCWVNEWQMIQYSANLAQPSQLWARLPDNGNPPAPDYGVEVVSKYEPVPLADTCAFDAEYQARQTAAELLAREIARARELANYEARMSQAIVDAERVKAIIDLDAIPAVAETNDLLAQASSLGPMLCGGESREIMSIQCFPNQLTSWKANLPYAPSVVDEYAAYDLEARDQHWLGGLGKSWKLRSALGARSVATLVATNDQAAEDAWSDTNEVVDAPESFVAPDLVASDFVNWELGGSDLDGVGLDGAGLIGNSAQNDAEMKAYFDGIALQAQRSAAALLELPVNLDPMLPGAEVQPELLPDLEQSIAAASLWIEDQQCRLASEMCGFDSAYQLGNWLGTQSLHATQFVVDKTIAVAHYLDLPSDDQPGMNVYVIYVDSEGNSLAVPSSLARAWNRPEVESESAQADPAFESSTDSLASESVADDDDTMAVNEWELLDQVGAQVGAKVVAMLANQLDTIGMRLMQASDFLSSWADTQIASRESAVR